MRLPRLLFLLAFVAVILPPTAFASENIYAGDVSSAQRELDGARIRWSEASRRVAEAQGELPARRDQQHRLEAEARRAAQQADRARAVADRDRQSVLAARTRASASTAEAARANAQVDARWRAARAGLALWSTVAVALLAAVGLVLRLVPGRARNVEHQSKSNLRMAGGAAVGALVVEVSMFVALGAGSELGRLAAGAVTALAAPAAALMAVRRGLRPRTVHAAPLAAALALAATWGVAAAVQVGRPSDQVVPAATARLAAAQRTRAPLPSFAVDSRRRSDDAATVARSTERRAAGAHDRADALAEVRRAGLAEMARTKHAQELSSRHLAAVQRDFDRYQALLPLAGARSSDPPTDDDLSLDDPSIEDDGLDVYEDEPDSSDELASDDDPDPYESTDTQFSEDDDAGVPDSSWAPTTERFGSGRGRIGQCEDGTLSDSIGRSGACSHHGGVAGG